MTGERKKGIPIFNGRRTVRDDQPPVIDPYGLAMLESLCGGLQMLLFDVEDPANKQRLEHLTEYAESLADRYS